jgi:hypothetical protein
MHNMHTDFRPSAHDIIKNQYKMAVLAPGEDESGLLPTTSTDKDINSALHM